MSNVPSRSRLRAAVVAGALSLAPVAGHADQLMWTDHLGFLAGDPSVNVSFNAVNSGVGGDLAGLIIQSTTTGEDADGGGRRPGSANKKQPGQGEGYPSSCPGCALN